MVLFLTSNIGGSIKENGNRYPCKLRETNQIIENLKKFIKDGSKCLIISSDPENDLLNDSVKYIFSQAFQMSDMPFSVYEICDGRNEDDLPAMLEECGVVLLAGGHVPTQNRFFERLHLRDHLRNYHGTVIGISAGTMNCADIVYAQPELEGEVVDPSYKRYISGLGLTKYNVLPHFQEVRSISLDGLRIFDDITIPDSRNSPILALVDGSYVLTANGVSTLYGEAYWIENGVMEKICDHEGMTVLDLLD